MLSKEAIFANGQAYYWKHMKPPTERYKIRKLTSIEDKVKAARLAMNVFMEYETPDYSQEGVEIFRTYVNDREVGGSLDMYGAFLGDQLVGMIATRNNGSHISLFFVDGERHRIGIGRLLFSALIEGSTLEAITVNSSPYAVEVYHRLGFKDTDERQLQSGIVYTPMAFKKD